MILDAGKKCNFNKIYYMRTLFLFSFFLSILYYDVRAQQIVPDTNAGKVEIIKDAQIDDIIKKKIELNKKIEGKVSGYRVQIHFSADRNKAKEIKSNFLLKYPDVATYEIYQQPNFKIRVGDFKNKLDAYRFLKQISNDFTGAFIVDDDVKMVKID